MSILNMAMISIILTVTQVDHLNTLQASKKKTKKRAQTYVDESSVFGLAFM